MQHMEEISGLRAHVEGNAVRFTSCVWQVQEVHALLEAGLASGEVQPLPITEFPASRAADALRHLAAGAQMLPLPNGRICKCRGCIIFLCIFSITAFRQGLQYYACAMKRKGDLSICF